MAIAHEFHDKFSKLPETGVRARHLGEKLYFTGKKCARGHLCPRYASSGNCVDCIANARGKVTLASNSKGWRGSAVNREAALKALEAGAMEYFSNAPCPSGHLRRHPMSNNCLDCDVISRTKRKATARWARIRKEYGLSEFDVVQMLKNQDRRCAICKKDVSTGYHIDHCHLTRTVRGLLCSRCNQAIGLFDENEQKLNSAINYLRANYAAT